MAIAAYLVLDMPVKRVSKLQVYTFGQCREKSKLLAVADSLLQITSESVGVAGGGGGSYR